jgi:hypothetical protein
MAFSRKTSTARAMAPTSSLAVVPCTRRSKLPEVIACIAARICCSGRRIESAIRTPATG